MRSFRTSFMTACLAALCRLALADAWTPPAIPSAPAQLPRLAAPLAVDGALGEWAGAASIPVRSFADVTHLSHEHQWRGPADASMEVFCAWKADGLCLAAVVADDDVRVSSEATALWQKDCVEFFVDGRVGEQFMRQPYSAGAYQILVRAPTVGSPVLARVNSRDGTINGLKAAGKRTPAGYTIELLVPWSAFPALSACTGSRLGLQFSLNEYDARDGTLQHPLVLSHYGAKDLWLHPERFIEWRLVDRIETGRDSPLDPLAILDTPVLHAARKPMPIRVELGRFLSGRAGSLRFRVTGPDGRAALERTVKPSDAGGPWRGEARAGIGWTPKLTSDGYCIVSVAVCDKSGKPIGTLARPVLFLGNAVDDAISRVKRADIARLSRTQPFKAAAYLGAAACVEKLKRSIELGKPADVIRAVRETQARLEVLERGKLKGDQPGLLDLLNLTADPEAQVVVEYPESDAAVVLVYWGSVPIATADVRGQAAGASTDRSIKARSPSQAAGKRLADLIAAGAPISAAHAEAMHAEVVKSLPVAGPAAKPPDGTVPFCGDLHSHSFYSDGKPSPAGLALEAMYCYMDFLAETDHNTIQGAQLIRSLLDKHGFGFPLIVGEEITTDWAHFNAYPLTQVVAWDVPLYEIARAAHAQGAVIQWNHPEAVLSDWAKGQLPLGLAGTGLDAWEHIPTDYEFRKKAGELPLLTGTTDTHDGTFSYPERTIVFAPSPRGDDVAEAIRWGRAVAVEVRDFGLLCGSDEMIAAAAAALADGQTLKDAKKRRLAEMLARADVAGLLRASKPRPVQ